MHFKNTNAKIDIDKVNIMKNKLKYLPTLILTLITVFAGAVLTSAKVGATNPETRNAVVNVNTACVFDDDFSHTYTLNLSAGTSGNTENPSRTPATVTCNNVNGFDIKAVGFSPDATHPGGDEGNTSMYSASGTIATGTSGTNSYWAMKVTSATVTSSHATPTTVTVPAAYDGTYGVVPASATPVATFSGSTEGPVTGTFKTDYEVYVSSTQAAGTYTGAVKYTIVGRS